MAFDKIFDSLRIVVIPILVEILIRMSSSVILMKGNLARKSKVWLVI